MTSSSAAVSRARRWFWALLLIAGLAMGVLYRAMFADPRPTAGAAVLISGTVLALSTMQAARVMRALRGPLVLDVHRLYQPPGRRRP